MHIPCFTKNCRKIQMNSPIPHWQPGACGQRLLCPGVPDDCYECHHTLPHFKKIKVTFLVLLIFKSLKVETSL